MKIDQSQFEGSFAFEGIDETASTAILGTGEEQKCGMEDPEVQLHKLFLARLDVHSRIAELNRNRTKLQAQKVDVHGKIAQLFEFDAKLMQKEEEISRSITDC